MNFITILIRSKSSTECFENWARETDAWFYNRKETPDRSVWIKKFQEIRRRWCSQFVCN